MQGSYWGDGEVFRPERFITESGELRREERLVPHATGRRQCPGQLLAKAELFLFFSGLLHSFTLAPEVSLFHHSKKFRQDFNLPLSPKSIINSIYYVPSVY